MNDYVQQVLEAELDKTNNDVTWTIDLISKYKEQIKSSEPILTNLKAKQQALREELSRYADANVQS